MNDQPETHSGAGPLDAGQGVKADVDPEELKSVKEVITQVTKAVKICKLYLPNNPIYQKALQELHRRFSIHLEEYGEIRLMIEQYKLAYHEQSVYQNSNLIESLAFKLYVDGLRGFSFSEMLDLDEMTAFLEIIGRKHDPENPDNDIVTLLWEQRFKHISYLVSEDFIQETSDEPSAPDAGKMQSMIQKETSTAKPTAVDSESVLKESMGVQLEGGTLKSIFAVTEEELAKIKQEMVQEEGSDLTALLLDILTEILRIEKEDESFAEIINIFDGLLAVLIGRGDLVHAIRILNLFHGLMGQDPGLSDHHRGCLENSFRQLYEPNIIKDLEKVLNQITYIGTDQFSEFLILLGRGSVELLLNLLGGLTQARARRSLCDVLVNLCKDNVEPLLGHLEDSRLHVVKDVLYILGKIGDPKSLDQFRQLVTHPEARIRKELVSVLDGMQDVKSRKLLMMCLHDSDIDIRLQVVRSLTNAQYEPAQQAFIEIINGKDFQNWDLSEKREWFKALGRIGGNAMIALFGGFLREGMSSGWFKKANKEEMALCAVEGLRRIGSEEARAVLMKGQQAFVKRIRDACTRALELKAGS